MTKKHKTETIVTTVDDAFNDVKMIVSDLLDEMTDWRDNLSGTALENTSKYSDIEECVEELETIQGDLESVDLPDDLTQVEITYYWIHPYGKHISRAYRLGQAESAIAGIVDMIDETEEQEWEDVKSELENIDFGNVPFPSMF